MKATPAKRTGFARAAAPDRVDSPYHFLCHCMKSAAVLSASMLLTLFTQTALADVAPSPQAICSSRMTGAEKAQCLVKQRQEILRQMGRLPPPSQAGTPVFASSASSESSVSSQAGTPALDATSSSSASPTQPRSCARLGSLERAQCLAEQHKEILRQLATQSRPTIVTPAPVQPQVPARANCNRIRDGAVRAKCQAENWAKTRGSSSSSR